ncbi:fimbria/pilus outer membrane usher protein [Pseudomonas pseudonitroreducens]|uniref:fimbria/pilus outer membrane usher protein n=1 Tax=Pseudomonas pseudonitroreducens TaxID=2892326 RepID=UPI001F3DDA91|nr:fimbria/pilus outer membrane usher protein [Pseudomonas pseudonitroreducens]
MNTPSRHPVHRFAFALKPLAIALALALLGGVADAADGSSVKFDNDMLWGRGAQSLNLTRFREGNTLEPGVHTLDVWVNEQMMGRQDIRFIAEGQAGRGVACLTRLQLETAGVDLEKLTPAAEAAGEECVDLPTLIQGATSSLDTGEQRLLLSIPQAFLRSNPRGYVSPERWDRGVNAAFLDYSTNAYQSVTQGETNRNAYASLNGGVNLGDWRLRQRSSLNWDSDSGSDFQNLSTYAQRDIDSLRSQLTLGDAFTDGDLFDAVSIRGLRMATDDRMLPDSQRGYAPVVRGVAATNARVTIRQNGYVIQEVTVAPGAFEISDLNPTSDNGDLDVTVTEADGQESHFTVPFSSVARSLRPGVSRYTLSVGQARDLSYGSAPKVAQATYQRGLTNSVTGYTGATASEGYAAGLLGGVLTTEYGAFGADITHASTQLDDQSFTGQSLRLSYNKILQSTGTHFTVAAYRYSTDGYFGFTDALNARDQLDEYGDSQGGVDAIRRTRSRSEVNVSQNVGSRGYLYVNGSRQNYWNDTGFDTQYQAGYTHNWSWGSTSVSAARTQDAYGTADNRTLFSVSLPIGKAGTNRPYLSSSYSQSSKGSSNLQSTLSGTAGKEGQVSYGLTASHDSPDSGDSSSSVGANSQYRTSFGTLNGSVSESSDYRQLSAGMSGSVVAHPSGITFGQNLGDSIAIIDAPGAAGASVSSAANVKLDGQGQAVVPYQSPYRVNSVELDPKGLDDDVELKTTLHDVVPRSGAVMLVKYDTVKGHALLIQSRRADGSALPFGASVYDEQNQEVGMVGQGGKIFARVNADQGVLHVPLDSAGQCSINYRVAPRVADGASAPMETLNETCK